jgi:hypothetical protein
MHPHTERNGTDRGRARLDRQMGHAWVITCTHCTCTASTCQHLEHHTMHANIYTDDEITNYWLFAKAKKKKNSICKYFKPTYETFILKSPTEYNIFRTLLLLIRALCEHTSSHTKWTFVFILLEACICMLNIGFRTISIGTIFLKKK